MTDPKDLNAERGGPPSPRGTGGSRPPRESPAARASSSRRGRPPRVLLFDGECGICTWFAERARRVDRRARYAILPYQDLDAGALAPYGITPGDCTRRLYVLEPWPLAEGRTEASLPRAWGGAVGLNAFFWSIFPWSVLVALLYLLPPLLLLEGLAYRWVARHRTEISRRLGLRGCRIPS